MPKSKKRKKKGRPAGKRTAPRLVTCDGRVWRCRPTLPASADPDVLEATYPDEDDRTLAFIEAVLMPDEHDRTLTLTPLELAALGVALAAEYRGRVK